MLTNKSFMRHKAWKFFVTNLYAIVALFSLVVCLFSFFGYTTFSTANNTDSSWQYSLSGLRHAGQTLGSDVFFNYGPLYEKVLSSVHARDTLADYVVGGVLFTMVAGSSILALIRLIKNWSFAQNTRLQLGLAFGSIFLFASLTEIDVLFYICLLITIFAAQKEKSLWLKYAMLGGIYIFSLYKFSLTLPAIVLSPIAFLENKTAKKVLQPILLWLGSLAILVAAYIMLTLSASPTAFGRYMYYGLVNSIFYSEFMSLTIRDHFWEQVVYMAFFGLAVAAFGYLLYQSLVAKRLQNRLMIAANSTAVMAVLYLAFKHAIVRNDNHLLGLTPLLFIGDIFIMYALGALRFSLAKPNAWLVGVLCGVLGVSTAIHAVMFHNLASPSPRQYIQSRAEMLAGFVTANRYDYGSFRRQVATAQTKIDVRAAELKPIQQQLAERYPKRELIFYGNTTLYGEALRKDRDVLYMPFLQNYSAHPPQLFDARYIEMLKRHPQALVFAEETEPSINERIPSHELNNFYQYLIHNYTVVLKNDERKQYVFARTANGSESCRETGTFSFVDNQQVPVPRFSTQGGAYQKLVIKSHPAPGETLFAAVLKKPVYTIKLTTPGGAYMLRRTTPTTLAHGITVTPLYQSILDFDRQAPFELDSFAIGNGFPTTTRFTATSYSCHY